MTTKYPVGVALKVADATREQVKQWLRRGHISLASEHEAEPQSPGWDFLDIVRLAFMVEGAALGIEGIRLRDLADRAMETLVSNQVMPIAIEIMKGNAAWPTALLIYKRREIECEAFCHVLTAEDDIARYFRSMSNAAIVVNVAGVLARVVAMFKRVSNDDISTLSLNDLEGRDD